MCAGLAIQCQAASRSFWRELLEKLLLLFDLRARSPPSIWRANSRVRGGRKRARKRTRSAAHAHCHSHAHARTLPRSLARSLARMSLRAPPHRGGQAVNGRQKHTSCSSLEISSSSACRMSALL